MLVVSNTSPLTNLAAIDRFGLLESLFGEVHIAEGVWRELNAGNRPHPGSKEVASSSWVHRHSVENRPLVATLRRDLDPGEAETLALALALNADLVLLDEKEARRAAVRVGLRRLGVLGILLEAKRRRLLDEVRPSLDALRQIAGFYVSDALYREVLKTAGEN